jgi:hypothetical protein
MSFDVWYWMVDALGPNSTGWVVLISHTDQNATNRWVNRGSGRPQRGLLILKCAPTLAPHHTSHRKGAVWYQRGPTGKHTFLRRHAARAARCTSTNPQM